MSEPQVTEADREKAAELRAQVVEAMSWAETFDSGRIGREGATALLDQYVVAERAKARAPFLALAKELSDAKSRLTAGLMAVEPRLREPYPDDPRWTPWTRFVRDRLTHLREVADRIRRAAEDPT